MLINSHLALNSSSKKLLIMIVMEITRRPLGGIHMNKIQLTTGVISLITAAILAILNLTKVEWFAQHTAVTVYPAAALALLGLVLLFRGMFKRTES